MTPSIVNIFCPFCSTEKIQNKKSAIVDHDRENDDDHDTDINRDTRSDTGHRFAKTSPSNRPHSALPRLNSTDDEPAPSPPAPTSIGRNAELDESISKVSQWQRSLESEQPDQPIPTPLPIIITDHDDPGNVKTTNFGGSNSEHDDEDEDETFFSTKDDLTPVPRKQSAVSPGGGISFLRASDFGDGGNDSPSYRTPGDGGGTPRSSSLADVDDQNLETDYEDDIGAARTPSPTEEAAPVAVAVAASPPTTPMDTKPPLPKPRTGSTSGGISFLARSDSRDSGGSKKSEPNRYSSFQVKFPMRMYFEHGT